ncbi:SGNH/GDSL hydrolase family protein [Hydrogenophaga palleronii]|uniref:SGNH/GDSL hydrolase family protein n=1 Tax=Hydrogenophaga palleronii TaxID=65655 RepID=UPI000B319066|nr:SGNH/GDSL hydrolase family protein [Hydrogenophaga palleronii]
MFLRTRLALAASAVFLVACGGGGGDDSPPPPAVVTSAVKVVGDSLSDSGTFGLKFTVQNATTPYAIWTEHVAAAVSAPALCPRYTNTLDVKPAPSTCTSYGVGGATINPTGTTFDATPRSVVQQLKDVRAQGPYSPQELLLVDGGGNDLADLTSAYLGAAADAGVAFGALTGELLTPGETAAAGTLPAIGTAYAVKLADALANAITSEALDRDAQRVVVITVPDITRTPKFLAVLAGVKLQVDGAGGNGDAQVAAIRALVNQWTVALNNQLKTRFAAQSRVAVVDFYAELNRWLDTPAQFGLTNTTRPACPRTGTDTQGLPSYAIATCTDTSLSAAPPVGETGANWWRTYVFSDDFHGTPRTNELMGQLVVRALEAKGWK